MGKGGRSHEGLNNVRLKVIFTTVKKALAEGGVFFLFFWGIAFVLKVRLGVGFKIRDSFRIRYRVKS